MRSNPKGLTLQGSKARVINGCPIDIDERNPAFPLSFRGSWRVGVWGQSPQGLGLFFFVSCWRCGNNLGRSDRRERSFFWGQASEASDYDPQKKSAECQHCCKTPYKACRYAVCGVLELSEKTSEKTSEISFLDVRCCT